MKPTLLEAFEKGCKIIDSMTIKSISSCRRYITLFSKMFVYGNMKNSYLYREDLLWRFEIKLNKLCKNKEDEI